ncbi:hypothetical protein ABZ760_37250, partial [Streptomyces sp. NPDC006658]|uniref:hypothetical protein n=1 Tax=Streptomyces sp. NPDC006658 TaxID=3156900 RepID=UPI0033D77F5E
NLPTQQALAWSGMLLKIVDVGAKWAAPPRPARAACRPGAGIRRAEDTRCARPAAARHDSPADGT